MKKNGLVLCLIVWMISIVMNGTTVYAAEMFYEPKVVVTSYEIVEGVVANGEEFTMKLQLTNMNQYADAYNIVLAMNSSDNNLVIMDGKSNLTYYDMIKAGETVECLLNCRILDGEENGINILTFTSSYYNAYGYQYSVESKITLAVENQIQLEIPAITVSDNAVVGANALVSVSYSNTDNTKLKNIKMKIEGNIPETQKVVDLGNLEADVQKYKDYYVTFGEAGNQKLQISFEYQDKGGNTKVLGPYEYSIKVYPYVVSEETEYIVDTDKLKLGIKEVYMLAIGSILLLIMIVTGIFKLRTMRCKEARK